MAMASTLLGWVVAGRVLRPLRTITTTTREISETSLNRRLAIAGPRDELMELAETIDGLLERLEAAFEAQRRFVANASHELRTPLAMMRTTLDVAVAKPGGVPLQTRALDADLRLDLDHADRLLDGFLVLGARAASRAGRPAPRCARAGDRRRAGVAGWRDCGIPDRGTHGAHPGLRPWERDPAGADGWKRDRERCEERHSDQPGKSSNARITSRLFRQPWPASSPKPSPVIKRHVPDNALGKGVRLPMRHLGMPFDDLSHGGPMPFVLAWPEPPCRAICPCCGSIGFEMRFRNWRHVSHAAKVVPLEQKWNIVNGAGWGRDRGRAAEETVIRKAGGRWSLLTMALTGNWFNGKWVCRLPLNS